MLCPTITSSYLSFYPFYPNCIPLRHLSRNILRHVTNRGSIPNYPELSWTILNYPGIVYPELSRTILRQNPHFLYYLNRSES